MGGVNNTVAKADQRLTNHTRTHTHTHNAPNTCVYTIGGVNNAVAKAAKVLDNDLSGNKAFSVAVCCSVAQRVICLLL